MRSVLRRTRIGAATILALLLVAGAGASTAGADDTEAAPDGGKFQPGLMLDRDGAKGDAPPVPAEEVKGNPPPSTLKERREWERAPKAERQKVNIDQFAEGPSTAEAFDPVTLRECSDHDFDGDKPYYWHKNRFSSCVSGYDNLVKPAGCPIFCSPSINSFRFVMIGVGDINYAKGKPVRTVNYKIRTSAGAKSGPSPAPDSTPVTLDIDCVTPVGGACRAAHPNGITRSLGALRSGVTLDFGFRITGRSPDPADKDNKTYHDTRLKITQPNPDYRPRRVTTERDGVRCDTSTFNSHPGDTKKRDNGACIFEDIDSTLYYSRAQGSPHKVVAEHIYDAQKRPSRTKPGVPGTFIYGDPASQHKLYRVVPAWSKKHEQRYNDNRKTAIKNCVKYWGKDYANGPGGEKRDCDEYPFASTYEGAAYDEYNGGSTAVSYSSRPLNRKQNRSAGAALGKWYSRDHILEQDGYWVVIP